MEKDAIKLLAEQMAIVVDNKLKDFKVDKTFPNCKIISANGNRYKVRIANQEKNVISLNGITYKIGELVSITVPCSDWNKAYIIGQVQSTTTEIDLKSIENRIFNLEHEIKITDIKIIDGGNARD